MQRLSHLTTSGGQHGQESEEGESENEEGEEDQERSEEDCEEDPQGRQEEEVSSLWNRRQLDAGEVVGAEENLFPQIPIQALATREGVGETSGQTVGSSFRNSPRDNRSEGRVR
jgi:hypothetical protein